MTLDRTRYNQIYPEKLPESRSKGRAAKPFTVIATPKKAAPPVRWNHCKIHIGTQLIRGFLCEHCRSTLPCIRIVDVIPLEEKEKSN